MAMLLAKHHYYGYLFMFISSFITGVPKITFDAIEFVKYADTSFLKQVRNYS